MPVAPPFLFIFYFSRTLIRKHLRKAHTFHCAKSFSKYIIYCKMFIANIELMAIEFCGTLLNMSEKFSGWISMDLVINSASYYQIGSA